MPAKNTNLKFGKRDFIFDKKFYNNLKKTKNLKLSYSESKAVINKANDNIAQAILQENDGFKLPFGLGYICVTRFKSKNLAIDWNTTKKIGQRTYFTNLSTLGNSIAIKWFKVGKAPMTIAFLDIFKFRACRKLSRSASAKFKNGKQYSEWGVSDFYEKGRLENLYDKKFRQPLNIEDNG